MEARSTPSHCPVCPFSGLGADDLTCPSCGADLTALRRLQELPLALLDDALRLLAERDAAGAVRPAAAAAAFDRTRPAALLALGDARARLGDLDGAEREWRLAAAAGLDAVVRDRLTAVAALQERALAARAPHAGLLYRSRLPAERACRAVAELFAGHSVREAASAAGCSAGTVRRLRTRALLLGPGVADEVAAGLGTPPAPLRRQWRAFAARARRA